MPWYFRQAKLGPLVGKRTWGGLVGIGGYPPLIDGGSVTAPHFAFCTPGRQVGRREPRRRPGRRGRARPDAVAQGPRSAAREGGRGRAGGAEEEPAARSRSGRRIRTTTRRASSRTPACRFAYRANPWAVHAPPTGSLCTRTASGVSAQIAPHVVDRELLLDERTSQQEVPVFCPRARGPPPRPGAVQTARPDSPRSTTHRVPGGKAFSSLRQMPPTETLRTWAARALPRRQEERAREAQSPSPRGSGRTDDVP